VTRWGFCLRWLPHHTKPTMTMIRQTTPNAQQLDLFTDGDPSKQTRRIAYASSLERGPSRRGAIELYVASCGRTGATRNECSEALGIPINCVCGPILALVRSGRLIETSRTRLTPSGHPAVVIVSRLLGDDANG
jgi:hypothetical protein